MAASALVLALGGCARPSGHLRLSSPAFNDGGTIPARFGCEDLNLSPPLRWSDVPDGAVQLALVMADLGAPGGTFHHWIVVGIDPGVTALQAGELPAGALAMRNSADSVGYVGPCPPAGETHEYLITVFPLGKKVALGPDSPVADALAAIDAARIGGEGELRGRFRR